MITKTSLKLLISIFCIFSTNANDTIFLFGKVKSIDGKIIRIEQNNKEVIEGPKDSLIKFNDKNLDAQYFEIKMMDLKDFKKLEN